MARQAMHSNNQQNVQLAKNYDQYLKTLKDSMRGIQSDKEADKLLTREYRKGFEVPSSFGASSTHDQAAKR